MSIKRIPFLDLLSDIIDNRGKTCPTVSEGIPLIATNCIKNTGLYPLYEKVRYVDTETYNSWFRGHPKPGDIIFVTKGSPGQVNWVPDPVDFCIAQDMVSLRINESIVYPKYLFAILRTPKVQQMIDGLHVGTLIPHFKKGDFDKLVLEIQENYDEQKRIGDLYFTFCEKIELNLKMNKTLEELALAIYKEWFVDYGPFKNGEFVESELGKIPKGWKVERIGDIIMTIGGGTPKTKIREYWDEGNINWFSPTDITKSKAVFSLGSDKKITKFGLDHSSAKIFPAYSLMMTSRATIGETAINRTEACTNQGFITFIPNEKISLFQIYGWVKSHIEKIKSIADGSTFPEISKGEIRDFKILVADDNREFNNLVRPLFELIECNIVENSHLYQIREYLISKLISGEIKIKEAEELV